LQYYIGCSGWSYSAWRGPFYPSDIDDSSWLRYYSSVFDYVEIDSSFYKTPNVFTVKNWFNKTPDNFKFTAKFPKVITHDKRLKDVSKEIEYFFQSMLPLREKTLALLIQLPPSLKITEGIENLRQYVVPELDDRFRYAIEVRDRTWFQDLAYNFFADNNICMVWSQLAELRTPPIVTTDFLYLRFIGDRSIDEKDFGRIQKKDRVMEMKKWSSKVKRVINEEGRGRKRINLAIVSANNHYAGFGPGTATIFRKMVGLPEAVWSKDEDKDKNEEEDDKSNLHGNSIQDPKQSTISDFTI
jgi:uncharacterized protein YecE (DUF72 family)